MTHVSNKPSGSGPFEQGQSKTDTAGSVANIASPSQKDEVGKKSVVSTDSAFEHKKIVYPSLPGAPPHTPAPPIKSSSDSSYSANFSSWLDNVRVKSEGAMLAHNLQQPVHPLTLPNDKSWCTFLVPETTALEATESHVRLMLPLPKDPKEQEKLIGTWQVAAWISKSIQKSIDDSDEGRAPNCPFRALALPLAAIPGVIHDLKRVLLHLDFLQKMRDLTRFASVCRLMNLGSEHQWSYFYTHCFFAVCSQLRTGGTALLPSDHIAVKDDPEAIARLSTKSSISGDFETHAMTAVIQRESPWTDVCDVHHFETNGTNSAFIDWNVLDEKRRENSPGRVLDRSRQFAPHMFIPDEHFLLGEEMKKNPKIFVRSLGKTAISHIDSQLESTEGLQFESEVKFLRNLLSINHSLGFKTSSETLYQRRLFMAELSPDKYFTLPMQRMHATQQTGSCELKSTTTAVRFLLGENELSY